MAASELLFVGTSVVTMFVIIFNPIWFLNLLLLLIAYFAVLFFIETIASNGNNEKRITFKTEIFADVIVYIFDALKAKRNSNDAVIETKRNDCCGKIPDMQKELNTFAKNITSDYIKIWYTTVSENMEFINECENGFQELFEKAFIDHFSKLEVSQVFSVFLENLRNAMSDDHNLLDLKFERDYGVNFVNELLDFLQPSSLKPISKPKSHAMSNQDPIYITIRELLVDGALLPLVSLVTDPLWLNTVIIKYFSDASIANEIKEDKIETNTPAKPPAEKVKLKCDDEKSVQSTPEKERTKNNLLTRSVSAVFDRNLLMSSNLTSSASSASEPDISGDTAQGVPEGNEINDLKIFTNVKITKTQEVTISNEQFTVYCIECDALFEEIQGKNKSSNETENISSSLVRKKIHVKRRFREFTTLQSRLENNSRLKDLLTGVKEPSKLKRETQNLLDMAFGKFKLDKKTIEYRRQFLEQYLIALCDRDPIAHSIELQQFLGYGSDSRYAYVKSAQSILMPLRLDKVLTRSVKGAIKLIKVAMPDEPQEGVLAPSNAELTIRRSTSRSVRLAYGESFKLDHTLDDVEIERVLNINRDERSGSRDYLLEGKNFSSSLLGPRLQGDGCEQSDEVEKTVLVNSRLLYKEIPMASNLIDIFSCILWDKSIINSQVSTVFKVLLGQLIERFSQRSLAKYVTKDNVIYLTHCLHESIWDNDNSSKIQVTNTSPQFVVQIIYSSISSNLPFESKLHKIYKKILYKFVDCFQVQQRNKLFVYSFLRQLFLKV